MKEVNVPTGKNKKIVGMMKDDRVCCIEGKDVRVQKVRQKLEDKHCKGTKKCVVT